MQLIIFTSAEINHTRFQGLWLQNVFSVQVIFSSSTTAGRCRSHSVISNSLRCPGRVSGARLWLASSRRHKLHWQSSRWCIHFWWTRLNFLSRSRDLFTTVLAANAKHNSCTALIYMNITKFNFNVMLVYGNFENYHQWALWSALLHQ